MSNLYWKPEQPPPSTLTRSIVPAGSALEDLADPPRRPFADRDVDASIDRPCLVGMQAAAHDS